MKTFPEILRDAMLLLHADHESVVIARGRQIDALEGQALQLLRSKAFQLRLRYDGSDSDDEYLSHYKYEARCWLGVQWSNWHEHPHGWLGGAGFDIRDVLATDWRIVS